MYIPARFYIYNKKRNRFINVRQVDNKWIITKIPYKDQAKTYDKVNYKKIIAALRDKVGKSFTMENYSIISVENKETVYPVRILGIENTESLNNLSVYILDNNKRVVDKKDFFSIGEEILYYSVGTKYGKDRVKMRYFNDILSEGLIAKKD